MRRKFPVRLRSRSSPDRTPWRAAKLEKALAARHVLRGCAALSNDVGLFAGVHDPVSRQMLGNIPQAFSHVGLINKALNLDRRRGPERARASHDLVPQKDASAR